MDVLKEAWNCIWHYEPMSDAAIQMVVEYARWPFIVAFVCIASFPAIYGYFKLLNWMYRPKKLH